MPYEILERSSRPRVQPPSAAALRAAWGRRTMRSYAAASR